MKEKTILAQNIQTLRQKKGWTQEVLSSMCKLSAGAIIDYENPNREQFSASHIPSGVSAKDCSMEFMSNASPV